MLSLIEKLSVLDEFQNKKILLFGVDIFRDNDAIETARSSVLRSKIKSIKPYEKFDFGVKFDLIISNQVFEHINDLDRIYQHLSLILQERGYLIAGFPTKEIIIEPHLRIPFIHYFKKYSKSLYLSLSLFCF